MPGRPTLALAARLALASFVLAAGTAAYARGPIADANPSAVKPGVYTVEAAHTRILFKVSHMGLSSWYGDFTGASGSLTLDPKAPAASRVDITIPTASISTTNAHLDDELKAPDWFDAAKFPTITFKSSKVTTTGAGAADITGDLTLHGVTKPVVLHATFNGAGVNPVNKSYGAGFEATGRIKRSDFGVTKYVPMIGDDVDLIISGAFQKAAG